MRPVSASFGKSVVTEISPAHSDALDVVRVQ